MKILSGNSFDKSCKIIGLVGGFFGIILTIITITSEIYKEHNIEVVIPCGNVFDNIIEVPLLFKNKGDYDELISGINFYFVENYNVKNKENYINIASNKNILTIKKQEHKKIVPNFPVNLEDERFDFLINNNRDYIFLLGIEIIKENGLSLYEKIPFGFIKIADRKEVAHIEFYPTQKNIDFSLERYRLTITSLPRATQFDQYYNLNENID